MYFLTDIAIDSTRLFQETDDINQSYRAHNWMKIKTITCHDVYNTGASLQAYALQEYLSSLGHSVQIIDYKPVYLSRHYRLNSVPLPYRKNVFIKWAYILAKFPSRIFARKRKRVFDRFTQRYLRLSQRYSSNETLKSDLPQADLYIAGSDQIWNPLFPNGRDPSFFLDFVPQGKKRASYAASFAVDAIPNESQEFMRSMLGSFNFISVRETSGLDILKRIGITTGQQVVDPVFLLDRARWEKITPPPTRSRKYVFVYDFDKSDLIKKVAEMIAAERQLEIVSLQRLDYSACSYRHAGPLEFLSLIRNADCVVSNSFHATAFSVLFERDFYVVNRVEGVNARMRDLLCQLGLESRLVTDVDVIDVENISYSHPSKLISKKIDESFEFLDKVLSV